MLKSIHNDFNVPCVRAILIDVWLLVTKSHCSIFFFIFIVCDSNHISVNCGSWHLTRMRRRKNWTIFHSSFFSDWVLSFQKRENEFVYYLVEVHTPERFLHVTVSILFRFFLQIWKKRVQCFLLSVIVYKRWNGWQTESMWILFIFFWMKRDHLNWKLSGLNDNINWDCVQVKYRKKVFKPLTDRINYEHLPQPHLLSITWPFEGYRSNHFKCESKQYTSYSNACKSSATETN